MTLYDIEPNDRQNFKSAEKVSSSKIIDLLKAHVPDSEGTILYLEMMNSLISAYMDDTIEYWMQQQPAYHLDKNFITSNCYACIEINAHSIVKCTSNLHSTNEPQLFAPNLFDSQPCESTFRQLRSMSTTFSTIVNCSVLKFINRVKKNPTPGRHHF